MSGQALILLISVLSVPEPLLSDSCYFARGLETHLQLSKQHSVLLYESVKEATQKKRQTHLASRYITREEACTITRCTVRMYSIFTSLTILICAKQAFHLHGLQLLLGSIEMYRKIKARNTTIQHANVTLCPINAIFHLTIVDCQVSSPSFS